MSRIVCDKLRVAIATNPTATPVDSSASGFFNTICEFSKPAKASTNMNRAYREAFSDEMNALLPGYLEERKRFFAENPDKDANARNRKGPMPRVSNLTSIVFTT
jgi:hypothetical protein